ncbi:MAG: septation ring formation regulator EzrA [Comamonadaceae bacterium CG_4_9_14_3_um_filter_60_33]|nr:MAG: septation ring formation regulator EzrA [Comamonadaceae bacterium CG2_30_59_20]PIY27966.1 MAG: septation ring formation regulator EzrA [Comamonadaceae bacterium CG_4_10_14_3_um_filter_60_42]PJB42480.1 MAG: septation ring formation regulator EzrA [Comamonadaceae bacterium CG_4_9_14_3_um_filter_60_33]
MGSRSVMFALIALLVMIHGQLWFGRGSIANVAQLQKQLKAQFQSNQQAEHANLQLAAEVKDLKEGLEMIEEKARMELGMIKVNEIYVQIAKN